MSKKKSIPILVVTAILVIALIIGNLAALKYAPIITTYLGHKSYTVKNTGNSNENTEYFKRSFSSEAERLAGDSAAAMMSASEGFVLLRNEDGALPLSNNPRVTLFGVNSRDILYGGGGSGAVDTSTAPTLKSALEDSGFEVNPAMWDFYTTGPAKDIHMDVADMAGTGRYVIHEAHPDLLTATQTNTFSDYGDAAIVTIARSGSESSDVPLQYDETYAQPMDVEGYFGTVHSDPVDSPEDIGRHYLELTHNEEELLRYVSGQFDKVIVLINSGNPMELSFLEQDEFGVDACLWIGNPGQDGLYAVGSLLTGVANPSGRVVDTYAFNPLGAPAMANFGDHRMTGAEEAVNDAYVVYQEGIYVGYKYYETRYEDVVLGQGNAGSWTYADEVQFPFGYGLSYTTFTKELVDSKQSGDTFTFQVKVTNIGDREGKDVVQVYAQSPYTDYDKANGVEKAAVQLVGFAKTDTIKPGGSQTVTITVAEEELKSYDATANNGAGTFILEAGDYYFTVVDNAHEAVNNILAAKGASGMDGPGNIDNTKRFTLATSDKYALSTVTGLPIANLFSNADMRTYDKGFTYLTRSNWEGTFPQTYQISATPEMVAALAIPTGTDDPNAEMPATGQSNGLTLAMMREVPADDPSWEDLLDQLTPTEMYNLVRVGGYQTQAINSASAPSTICVDGPAYVGNAGTTGVTRPEATYAWCSEIVLASTWNVDVLENMGRLIGEDCLAQGDLNFAGWYAPAMNIHRTAFSGRNFEYYSEDGFLSGQMGAATVRGATERGVICFVKHFALNDQETNRIGMSTFANEQSIREIYLKAFEASVTQEKGTLGVMASMNRVGLTWSGNHKGLMTGLLRNEWGYNGLVITDQASFPQGFPALAIRGGLEGGIDLYLNTGSDNWPIEGYESNPTVMNQLRTASKHILYAVSRSFAMNGISSNTQVVQTMPLWQYWLIAADVVVGAAALVATVLLVKKTKWKE